MDKLFAVPGCTTDMAAVKLHFSNHLLSVFSFTFITLNLLLWLPLLAVMAIIRMIIPSSKNFTFPVVDVVYRLAVRVDTWWLRHVVKIEIDCDDASGTLQQLSPGDAPVVISNHQSWFDIFVLQALFTCNGPILKFVVKKELLWVPVVGWICLVMGFPRLDRSGGMQRVKDLGVIREASRKQAEESGALLFFPEGTRFTEKKRVRQDSKYENLLETRSGGFRAIQESVSPDTQVIDVSVFYRDGDENCWRCLGGSVKKVQVKINHFTMSQVREPAEWLQERWLEKENWLKSKLA